jgi:ABC-type enterochelin transport system permease subunit
MLVYFPAPQTSHALHTVLLIVVHWELTYWVLLVQVSQVLHIVLLVTLHGVLGYIPVEHGEQLLHTMLLVGVQAELMYERLDEQEPHGVQGELPLDDHV